mgnify:CR=1 FL=1
MYRRQGDEFDKVDNKRNALWKIEYECISKIEVYQKISILKKDKWCVLKYLANLRSRTVLSTLASYTSILIGDCLLPPQAEKYIKTQNSNIQKFILDEMER